MTMVASAAPGPTITNQTIATSAARGFPTRPAVIAPSWRAQAAPSMPLPAATLFGASRCGQAQRQRILRGARRRIHPSRRCRRLRLRCHHTGRRRLLRRPRRRRRHPGSHLHLLRRRRRRRRRLIQCHPSPCCRRRRPSPCRRRRPRLRRHCVTAFALSTTTTGLGNAHLSNAAAALNASLRHRRRRCPLRHLRRCSRRRSLRRRRSCPRLGHPHPRRDDRRLPTQTRRRRRRRLHRR